jgi:hypothetical protein
MKRVSDLHIARGTQRIRRWTVPRLPFDVVVDGEVVGTVRANDSFSCSVSPGYHQVRVKFDPENEISNVVEINIEQDDTAELRCSTWSGLAGFNVFLLGKHLFHIKLRLIDS